MENHWRASVPKQSEDSGTWRITALASLGPGLIKPALAVRTQYSQEVNNNNSAATTASSDDGPQHRIFVKKAQNGREKRSDYKGGYRRWPGVLLVLAMLGAAGYLLVTKAQEARSAKLLRAEEFERTAQNGRKIKDGAKTPNGDDIADDGQIGNPKSYKLTNTKCEQPDYQSKNGRLVAVAKNGTEVPFQVKGVNWFGMETSLAIPFGLWENQQNGTSAYEIAAFLSRNKFNAVRIPISIENVMNNNPPAEGVVNKASNRALNLKNFITSLQSIVEALAFRKIGVMISMHRLTNTKSGDNWFDPALGVSQDTFLKAMDTISKELCGEDYWNVIGVDLKNEPEKAEWGTGTDQDFVIGAEKIAKVMHANCPNWVAFVEGVVNVHTITLDGKAEEYYDWWGGGLQDAAKKRPQFTIPNKLVWAPHYYTSAVAPQRYFYGAGTTADYSKFEELGDEALFQRIDATMHDMFGYLVDENTNALVLGEFAGLYSKDAHPMKTTKRTTDLTIRVMMSKNYAGGFMWSLNPESNYEYNPANQKGAFTEGLLMDDWLTPNTEFLNAFTPMDSMPDLKPIPCFPVKREVTKKPPTDGSA